MTEKYPNLLDAWAVLLADNVPVQVRPSATATFEAALRSFYAPVTAMELEQAEQALAGLRQPGDTEDLDSPLWQVCSGDPADCEAAVEQFAPALRESLHAVLEELFEATGPAAQGTLRQ